MKENKRIIIDGVSVYHTHAGPVVADIPSDLENSRTLNISWGFGDVMISIGSTSVKDLVFLPDMRFRSATGGGNLPLIAEEFSEIPNAFKDNEGKLLQESLKISNADTIKSRSPVKINVGSDEDDYKYRISDITDDDQNRDEWSKFMDLEVAKNGNVTVTMRNTALDIQATISFNTEENGGKFPIMAEVFGRIAERIVNAHHS